MNRTEPIQQLSRNLYSERKKANPLGREKYAQVPNNMRTMDRSSAVRFFVQPMNYESSDDVILSEAKNLGLVLDASSSRGMNRDVSLSLNKIELFCRMGFRRPLPALMK